MRLSRAKLEFDLSVFEPFEFGAVVVLELFLEFAEGAFDHGDEGFAGADVAAERDDGVAFGEVVGDDEDFAVGHEFCGDAFDNVVGGLAGLGVDDFHFGGGGEFDADAGRRAGAVKDDGNGCADGIAVAAEGVDEFVAGSSGVAGFAAGEFWPGVKEAEAVD